ncbi:MAG: hypothetical protein M3R04_01195 [bacterium]|nr:hypothetical protein [bacterium]
MPSTCPSCSSDLTVYRNLGSRSEELIGAAREQLARGNSELAHEVVSRLPQLVSDLGPDYHSLAARVAITGGRDAEARSHLAYLPPVEREALAGSLQVVVELTQAAREEYNFALTAARQQRYEIAARHARRAVELEPGDAQMWQLKLKLDVKLGQWQQAYRDLAALDHLAARPEWAAGLEVVLPPLAVAI